MSNTGIFGRPAKAAIVAFALLAAPMADLAAAQDRPSPAGELVAGWVGFADDGIVSESLVGGTFRWYLLPRISVGPELVYIHGAHHSHLVVTGNVTWDMPRGRYIDLSCQRTTTRSKRDRSRFEVVMWNELEVEDRAGYPSETSATRGPAAV